MCVYVELQMVMVAVGVVLVIAGRSVSNKPRTSGRREQWLAPFVLLVRFYVEMKRA